MIGDQILALIVEDDESLAFVLGDHLKSLGIDAHFARNGSEALAKIEQNEFRFILMDIHMPVVNGYEATQAILKKKPESIILGITSSIDKLESARLLKFGAKGCIVKPIMLPALRKALETLNIHT